MRHVNMMTQQFSRGVFSVIGGFLLILVLSAQVWAATCTVDTPDDELDGGGNCSFRECVQDFRDNTLSAHGCTLTGILGIDDTIEIPDDTTLGGPVTLTRDGALDDTNENGDVDIDRDMKIIGAGADMTTITANFSTDNEDRLIHFPCDASSSCVDSDSNDTLEIHIEGVTLTGGLTRDSANDSTQNGGALLIESEPGTNNIGNMAVFLSDVHVTDNGAGGSGGGIQVLSDDQNFLQVSFNDVVVQNNQAALATSPLGSRQGGGAMIQGFADFSQLFFACDGCEFSGNTLVNPDAGVGGDGSGGGLEAIAQSVFADITNSSFVNNQAANVNGDPIGGAIAMGGQFTDLFMENVIVDGNTAGSGGGIGIGSELVNATIRHCDFENNTAPALDGGLFSGGVGGAGLFVAEEVDLVMDDTIFGDAGAGNQAATAGGAVFVNGNNLVVDATSSTFIDNQLTGNASGAGIGGALTVLGVPFFNLPVQGPTIARVRMLDHTRFVGNSAPTLAGGAAIFASKVEFDLQDTTFDENSSSSGGGLMILTDSTDPNSDLQANMERCSFYQNTATGDPISGGGLSFGISTGLGGGTYISSAFGQTTMTRCSFVQNSADISGGGLAYSSGSDAPDIQHHLVVQNSTFGGNTATNEDGGGISYGLTIGDPQADPDVFSGGPLDIINSTFADNTAGRDGGGLFRLVNVDVNGAIKSSIFGDNTAGGSGPDCSDNVELDGNPLESAGNNVVEDNTDCMSNFPLDGTDLEQDPALDTLDIVRENPLDPSSPLIPGFQTFPLTVTSPAINDGDDTVCTNPPFDLDQIFTDRFDVCDSGAREYVPECGNGILEEFAGEICDDGNQDDHDDCLSNCTLNVCGDLVLNINGPDHIEQCDDGGTVDGDGCSATCELEFCGDGIQQGDEECDDGNDVDTDDCLTNCKLATCGDGIIHLTGTTTEQCDDGNNVSGDGCDNNCQQEFCGDGVIQPQLGEECDDHNFDSGDGCSEFCQEEFCGDGTLQPGLGEECDDGGVSGSCFDYCDDTCHVTTFCGDGTVNGNEDCDIGPPPGQQNATCDYDCSFPMCGDSIVNLDFGEECDDGNTDPGDGCDATCHCEVPPSCGDGIVDTGAGETCEPTTPGQNDADCNLNCTSPTCGDGILNKAAGEQCEDGNQDSGDGCSATCQLEIPEFCGNGVVDPGEECDDGNRTDGDGCSSTCKDETQPENLGGCIGGGGCIFGACNEKDSNIDLSNVDLSFLSIYSARSLQTSRSNTYVLLLFFLTVGVIGVVRTHLAYRRK